MNSLPRSWPPHAPFAFLMWSGYLAAFLALTGALDTDAAGWSDRAVYWLVTVAVGVAAVGLLERVLRRRGGSALRWRLAGTLLALPLVTAAALALCIAMFGGEWSASRWVALLPTIGSMLLALQFPLHLMFVDAGAGVAAPPGCGIPSRLRDLMPAHLREGRLVALQAQDHYVEIHTSAGSVLLRMRFADAVELASEAGGIQPHRSWWVRRDAIARTVRKRGRTMVVLGCGMEVPVSRSGAKRI